MSDALDAMLSPAVVESAPVETTPVVTPEPILTPEVTPAPVVATPAPAEPAKPHEAIPLPVFLDMRDKLKGAEKRIAEFEAQRPTQQVPSVQDEQAYTAWMASELQRVAVGSRFESSQIAAEEKHGEEPVKVAMDWAMQRSQESPAFAAEYLKQKNPVGWAIKQQKRELTLADIGDDADAYVRRRAAELGLTTAAPAPVAQPVAAATPQPTAPLAPAPAPRSIASAPTAGSQHSVPTSPGTAFEAVFPS